MSRIRLSTQTKLMTSLEFWSLLKNALIVLDLDLKHTPPDTAPEVVDHHNQKRARVAVATELLERMKPQ